MRQEKTVATESKPVASPSSPSGEKRKPFVTTTSDPKPASGSPDTQSKPAGK